MAFPVKGIAGVAPSVPALSMDVMSRAILPQKMKIMLRKRQRIECGEGEELREPEPQYMLEQPSNPDNGYPGSCSIEKRNFIDSSQWVFLLLVNTSLTI